jgi:TATA-binding protein-associated factor Taf7
MVGEAMVPHYRCLSRVNFGDDDDDDGEEEEEQEEQEERGNNRRRSTEVPPRSTSYESGAACD